MADSLHAEIGAERLKAIVAAFYTKCMQDPMLAHFFMHVDHDELVAKQLDFLSNLLGGPKVYRGKSLPDAHAAFSIRPPHFARRQILLAETIRESGLEARLGDAWLALEARLRPLIMNQQGACSE